MTGKEWLEVLPEPLHNRFIAKMRKESGKEHIEQFFKRESSSLWECLCAGWLMSNIDLHFWKGIADEYDE